MPAWYMLWLVEQEPGNFAQAEAHLRQAIDLDGAFAVAHLNLANLLRQQSRLDEARCHASWPWNGMMLMSRPGLTDGFLRGF